MVGGAADQPDKGRRSKTRPTFRRSLLGLKGNEDRIEPMSIDAVDGGLDTANSPSVQPATPVSGTAATGSIANSPLGDERRRKLSESSSVLPNAYDETTAKDVSDVPFMGLSQENVDESECKVQDRFTLEMVLARYCSWNNIRVRFYCMFAICFLSGTWKGYIEAAKFISDVDVLTTGHSISCCCNTTIKTVLAAKEVVANFDSTKIVIFFCIFILPPSLTALELHVGRQKIMVIILFLGGVCSGIATLVPFMARPGELVVFVFHSTAMLLSFLNMLEMLPLNMRVFSMMLFRTLKGLGIVGGVLMLCTENGRFVYLYNGICTLGALALVFANGESSLPHLIVTRRLHEARKAIFLNERILIQKQNPNYQRRILFRRTKKIFEDLAYTDQEELKMGDFFKKLINNSAMIDLAIFVIYALATGMMQYEKDLAWGGLEVSPEELSMIEIFSHVVGCFILFLLRKVDRLKATCTILTTVIILLCIRALAISKDYKNTCTTDYFVQDILFTFEMIISPALSANVMALYDLVMLHCLELVPTILRPSVMYLYYGPTLVISGMFRKVFKRRGYNNSQMFIIYSIYFSVLVLGIVRVVRKRTGTSLVMYLIDLTPVDVTSGGDSDKVVKSQFESRLPSIKSKNNKDTEEDKTAPKIPRV